MRDDRLLPIHRAVLSGKVWRVKKMLEWGMNVDSRRCKSGMTPLHLAVKIQHPAIVRLLVEEGADVFARQGRVGPTPLDIAIELGNDVIAGILARAQARQSQGQPQEGRKGKSDGGPVSTARPRRPRRGL